MNRNLLRPIFVIAAVGVGLTSSAALGQSVPVGPSGQPLPRFVTLKSAKVNVRQGPGVGYEVAWVFQKSGLPVEIVQEFDNWRRIRDSEGASGWVMQTMLSGRRNAVIAPWEKAETVPLREKPSEQASVAAYLQPGVMAQVKSCSQNWCRLSDSRFEGWIRQDRLWGVYPGETID